MIFVVGSMLVFPHAEAQSEDSGSFSFDENTSDAAKVEQIYRMAYKAERRQYFNENLDMCQPNGCEVVLVPNLKGEELGLGLYDNPMALPIPKKPEDTDDEDNQKDNLKPKDDDGKTDAEDQEDPKNQVKGKKKNQKFVVKKGKMKDVKQKVKKRDDLVKTESGGVAECPKNGFPEDVPVVVQNRKPKIPTDEKLSARGDWSYGKSTRKRPVNPASNPENSENDFGKAGSPEQEGKVTMKSIKATRQDNSSNKHPNVDLIIKKCGGE